MAITDLDTSKGKAMMATALTAKANDLGVGAGMISVPIELVPGYFVTYCVLHFLELL